MAGLVVTGGSGFIGAAFIRRVAERRRVFNLDAGTYASDDRRLSGTDVLTHRVDVATDDLKSIFVEAQPDAVVHFAAETHVTRSETSRDLFFRTNVEGTRRVLEAADAAGVPTIVHVSTDEVYGPALERPFLEADKEPGEGRATSPYARSKAEADDLALTFETDARIVVARPTNCFGPWQHPEKAIARWTARALSSHRLPVWGDGGYVRDWMFVDDACEAIELLMERTEASGAFNIGPQSEPISNLEIATAIADAAGAGAGAVYLTEYDRPAHDRRYSVDSSKLRALGWTPRTSILDGIDITVDWYRDNRAWWEPHLAIAESLYADEKERS